jgi:hypothetical protein
MVVIRGDTCQKEVAAVNIMYENSEKMLSFALLKQ